VVGVAIVLALLLVVGVITASLLRRNDEDTTPPAGQLALAGVPAPAAGSPECGTLLAALPQALPGKDAALPRAELAEPTPPGTVAWTGAVSRPVVLRCGIDRPLELIPTARLRVVSGTQWLPVEAIEGTTTWYLVDRPVYVALTVPADAGTGPLQDVSAVAGRVLAPVPIRFN
jgi:hypothetical protein